MALSAAEDQPGGLDHGRYAQAKDEMSDESAHMSDDGVGAVRRAKAQRRRQPFVETSDRDAPVVSAAPSGPIPRSRRTG